MMFDKAGITLFLLSASFFDSSDARLGRGGILGKKFGPSYNPNNNIDDAPSSAPTAWPSSKPNNSPGDFFETNSTGNFFGDDEQEDILDGGNRTLSNRRLSAQKRMMLGGGKILGKNFGPRYNPKNEINDTPSSAPTSRPSSKPSNGPEEFFETNSTGDFFGDDEKDDFLDGGNRILSTSRLSAPKKMHFVRVDEEAVDIRLEWTTDATLPGDEQYLINPGMMFLEGDDGSVEWVRTIRFHSVEGEALGMTTYNNHTVREGIWRYHSAILLSSEKFEGDLSGGFDDESVMNWGLQTGSNMEVIDSHIISNEQTNAPWADLCEAEPKLLTEKGMLLRKDVTGPEDPKLVALPTSYSADWGLTFSSYPPVHSLPEMKSIEDCKWSEQSMFQMYLAAGGEKLAHGQDAPAHRLSCGDQTANEKNWIAFTYEDELYYVHSVQPHVVMKVDSENGSCAKVYETSNDYLEALAERVSVRGSATAIRYTEDSYLTLLHTHDKYSIEPYTTRAYTFETKPPFRVLRVSKPLKLQSSGLAFASSLTVHGDKVMVGYGVHDNESRVMIMSRDYLEQQFHSDCGGSVDSLVGDSGETCAEKVISLMLGEELMPPRRAMTAVGNDFLECWGLASDECKPEMVTKVSRHNKAHSCSEAFSRVADGVTCSARAKYLIDSVKLEPTKAFLFVADEFSVCKDVVVLRCSIDDLHWPDDTCKPTTVNSYNERGPAVLLSISHADSGLLRPMVQCSGISAETEKCSGDTELALLDSAEYVKDCLKEGQYHLVNAHAMTNAAKTAHSTVSMVESIAAKIARRSLEAGHKSNIILFTRNPLDVIFDWLEEVLHNADSGMCRDEFAELSDTVEGHDLILREMKDMATRNVQDWEVMKSFITNPSYNTMMVTGEELEDRLLQPSLLAEVSRFMGIAVNRTAILNGIQAMETFHTSKKDPKAMKANEFYLEMARDRMPYICHLMESVPSFLEATFEQGYGEQIAALTPYCQGFDEEWLADEGEGIFVGFSEMM